MIFTKFHGSISKPCTINIEVIVVPLWAVTTVQTEAHSVEPNESPACSTGMYMYRVLYIHVHMYIGTL